MPPSYSFIVGTFNTPHLYTLSFTPPNKLSILARHDAVGTHSWLHLSDNRKSLYATAWRSPPSVAAYSVDTADGSKITLLNTAATATRSGYVTATSKALYSAGGMSGEVFSLDPETGAIMNPPKPRTIDGTSESENSAIEPLQELNFLDGQEALSDTNVMDFGGLRHGAHSADLSPDQKALYVADIGRNCIWTYSISEDDGSLRLGEKYISPRTNDGPRHVWPHPNGKLVYCLQEHSSMVDVFECSKGGVKLKHVQAVRIIPDGLDVGAYWADEVRTSFSPGPYPKYLYASTRGLDKGTLGYVAVFPLKENGMIDLKADGENNAWLDMYKTPTSGGWANAVQPGPTVDGVEYLALTDSEEGLVMVVGWDGKRLDEAARVKLEEKDVEGRVAGAATAVWL